jgi:hypothetical protein
MRQVIIVAAAALAAAVLACGGAIAFIKLNPGESRDAGRGAQSHSSAPARSGTPGQTEAPRPTATVTESTTERVPTPQVPDYSDADSNFLSLIAADGIKAPADWAIEAGRATCGEDYDSAYRYLTDGGIYSYHVQTFLEDWTITHGGC